MNKSNWYVIYTTSGQEDKLVSAIKRLIPVSGGVYRDCFALKYENVWRKAGKSKVSVEIMFAGYVFVVTDQPELLFERLKSIPKLSKILAEHTENDTWFLALAEDEKEFLYSLIKDNAKNDYIVYRSFVKREGTRITKALGPLAPYMQDIVLADYQKRKVIVEKVLFGNKKRIKFCLLTVEDCREEGIDVPVFPGEEVKSFHYQVGDVIYLDSEAYEGQGLKVVKVNEKKGTVDVLVEMFGSEMQMTVSVE